MHPVEKQTGTVKRMPHLGTGCLASAFEGTTWWTEVERRLGLAFSFFVADFEGSLLVDRSLLATVIEQGTYWHLKSRVS